MFAPIEQRMESGEPVESLLPDGICEAYLGADATAMLATGAPVVMTGRVADPSLFLGTMLHGLGWSYDDYPKLATGTLAGHLMECAAQVTGGCFIDPGRKDAEDAVNIGFPYADVAADGKLVLGKLEDSGGRLDVQTCTEQVLYEMHDPRSYITAGLRARHYRRRVRCRRYASRACNRRRRATRTPSYKVVRISRRLIGEGEVGYAGPKRLRARSLRRDRALSACGNAGSPAPRSRRLYRNRACTA